MVIMDIENGDQVTRREYLCPQDSRGGCNYPQDSAGGYVTPIAPLIYAIAPRSLIPDPSILTLRVCITVPVCYFNIVLYFSG